MDYTAVIRELDAQIEWLQQARAALMELSTKRPKRRRMSAASRAKIAVGQRKRWAKIKAKKR